MSARIVGMPSRASRLASRADLNWPYFLWRWRIRAMQRPPYKPFHDDSRSVFIHIPKCGGMSVMQAFYGQRKQHGHIPAAAYRWADRRKFDDYLFFTIMRDPLERFVSAFIFLKAGGISDYDANWARRYLVWDDVDAAVDGIERGGLWNTIMAYNHFLPQTYFLRSGTAADSPLLPVLIGRQDDMQRSIDAVCDRLGRPRVAVAPLNVTRRGRRRKLSPATEAAIRTRYAEDVALWDSLPRC